MTTLERNCRKIEEWGEQLAEARSKGLPRPKLVLEPLQTSQSVPVPVLEERPRI